MLVVGGLDGREGLVLVVGGLDGREGLVLVVGGLARCRAVRAAVTAPVPAGVADVGLAGAGDPVAGRVVHGGLGGGLALAPGPALGQRRHVQPLLLAPADVPLEALGPRRGVRVLAAEVVVGGVAEQALDPGAQVGVAPVGIGAHAGLADDLAQERPDDAADGRGGRPHAGVDADQLGAGALGPPLAPRLAALDVAAVVGPGRLGGQHGLDAGHDPGQAQHQHGGGGRPAAPLLAQGDGGAGEGEGQHDLDPGVGDHEADAEGHRRAQQRHRGGEHARLRGQGRGGVHLAQHPVDRLVGGGRQHVADHGGCRHQDAGRHDDAERRADEQRRPHAGGGAPQDVDPGGGAVGAHQRGQGPGQAPHVPPEPGSADGPPVADDGQQQHGQQRPEQTALQQVALPGGAGPAGHDVAVVANGHDPHVDHVAGHPGHGGRGQHGGQVVGHPVGEPLDLGPEHGAGVGAGGLGEGLGLRRRHRGASGGAGAPGVPSVPGRTSRSGARPRSRPPTTVTSTPMPRASIRPGPPSPTSPTSRWTWAT